MHDQPNEPCSLSDPYAIPPCSSSVPPPVYSADAGAPAMIVLKGPANDGHNMGYEAPSLGQSAGYAMLQDLKVHVDIYMGTGFVNMQGRFRVPANAPAGSWTFHVPQTEDSLMTACTVHRNPKGCGPSGELYYELLVAEPPQDKDTPGGDYDPTEMKIETQLMGNDTVVIDLSYTQPMDYHADTASYCLLVPLGGRERGAPTYLPPGYPIDRVACVTCNLSVEGGKWVEHDTGLPMAHVGDGMGGSRWYTSKPGWAGKDLYVVYGMINEQISAVCLAEHHSAKLMPPPAIPQAFAGLAQRQDFNPYPGSTSLAVVLNPPACKGSGFYARNMVFILDRSYSMSGELLKEAKAALITALGTLNPPSISDRFAGDAFAVIAFDSSYDVVVSMRPATPENIAFGKETVANVEVNGATNIDAPMREAFSILAQYALEYQSQHMALPFIVLVTDGCVHDEPEIVTNTVAAYGNLRKNGAELVPRIFTLGLGTSCNSFFLKKLAEIGGGHSQTVIHQGGQNVRRRMLRLIEMASGPVLTNIRITCPAAPGLNLWMVPDPVPDLTCGAAVIVSARCPTESVGKVLRVEGRLWNGEIWSCDMQPLLTYVPVAKLFVRKQLDKLVAEEWIMKHGHKREADAERLRQEAIMLSTSTNVPCTHTRTYFAPMTPHEHATYRRDHQSMDAKARRDRNQAAAATAGCVILGTCLLGAVAFGMLDTGISPWAMDRGGLLGGNFDVGGGNNTDCCACCEGCCHDMDCDCDCDCACPDCGDCGDCGGCDCGGC
eukprot:TRINITY_DN22078_c0_g1_i1.p1 TRINITY_DN22078_c0_g1~~TRINITY_DN22078_c0_g1_i1.p1  ORF type:complete len:775 (+),score=98.66 TRINITY_DN22078_c0_g1_i1:67-2391(+)